MNRKDMLSKITAYVVNMEKDVEKRQAISRQLERTTKLDWSIVKACEGKKLSAFELEYYGYKEFQTKYKGLGTLPAFGCSVSHWSIYKKMAENNVSSAVILEDDAWICEDTENIVESVADFLNETDLPTAVLLTPDFIYYDKSMPILQLYGDKAQYLLRDITNGYMTSGYMINLAAAKLLAEKLFPINYIADCWGDFSKFGLHLMGIVPHIVSYSGEFGEIGRSQHPENEPIMLKFRHKLGRAKAQINAYLRYAKGYRRSKKEW